MITKEQLHDIVDSLQSDSPAAVFLIAERLCALAYSEQGGATEDPDVSDERWEERRKRKATGFELLYCKIRDMANDHHREAQRRHAGVEAGMYNKEDLDERACIEATFRGVYSTVADWDY